MLYKTSGVKRGKISAFDTEENLYQRKRGFWKRFFRHKFAVAGLIIFMLIVLMAVFASVLAPYDPLQINATFEAAPSSDFILGTDTVGRDVLSRVIYSARISLVVGVGSVLVSAVTGIILGLVSGFFGGAVDAIVMRLADIFMSFPQMTVSYTHLDVYKRQA